MTAVNQDFEAYIEDNDLVYFTVVDNNGTAIDISTVPSITWKLVDGSGATKIMKTATFVTSGVDGRCKVALSPADKASLAGWYFHFAYLVDGVGNVSTFECGRGIMKVRALGD